MPNDRISEQQFGNDVERSGHEREAEVLLSIWL
jgi:hypothetical protein